MSLKIMAIYLRFSAMDDIPRADEIRTLVKDIWDLRVAKLRSSVDTFVRSDAVHAKVFIYIININFEITTCFSYLLPFSQFLFSFS